MAVIDFDIPCLYCGASLRGCDIHGTCRGCGRPVGHIIHLEVVDRVSLRITHHIDCLTCGYNLKTLSIGGRCPECGVDVCRSIRANCLRFASRLWLWDARRGTSALLMSSIILLVGVFLWEDPSLLLICAAPVLGMFGWIALIHGVFNTTAMDSLFAGEPRPSRIPVHLARIAVVICPPWAFLRGLYHADTVRLAPELRDSLPPMALAMALDTAWHLLAAVGAIGWLICMRRIARRLRHRWLSGLTLALICGTALVSTASLSAELAGFPGTMTAMTPLKPVEGGALYDFIAFLAAILLLTQILALCLYRYHLGRALFLARRRWMP